MSYIEQKGWIGCIVREHVTNCLQLIVLEPAVQFSDLNTEIL